MRRRRTAGRSLPRGLTTVVVLAKLALLTGCGGIAGPAQGRASRMAQVEGISIMRSAVARWAQIEQSSEQATTGGGEGSSSGSEAASACAGSARGDTGANGAGGVRSSAARSSGACSVSEKQANEEALGFLIHAAWVAAEAQRHHVQVSSRAVETELGQIRKTQFPAAGSFHDYLMRTKQSEADLRQRVWVGLLLGEVERVIVSSVHVPSATAVAAYYAANRNSFLLPERRYVDFVRAASRAGARTARALVQHGVGSGEVTGGLAAVGHVSRLRHVQIRAGEQPRALSQAVVAAPVGRWEGPVAASGGFYDFRVEKVAQSRDETLSEAQPRVRQQLLALARQRALATFTQSFNARWRARTRCAPAFYMTAYCSGSL